MSNASNSQLPSFARTRRLRYEQCERRDLLAGDAPAVVMQGSFTTTELFHGDAIGSLLVSGNTFYLLSQDGHTQATDVAGRETSLASFRAEAESTIVINVEDSIVWDSWQSAVNDAPVPGFLNTNADGQVAGEIQKILPEPEIPRIPEPAAAPASNSGELVALASLFQQGASSLREIEPIGTVDAYAATITSSTSVVSRKALPEPESRASNVQTPDREFEALDRAWAWDDASQVGTAVGQAPLPAPERAEKAASGTAEEGPVMHSAAARGGEVSRPQTEIDSVAILTIPHDGSPTSVTARPSTASKSEAVDEVFSEWEAEQTPVGDEETWWAVATPRNLTAASALGVIVVARAWGANAIERPRRRTLQDRNESDSAAT